MTIKEQAESIFKETEYLKELVETPIFAPIKREDDKETNYQKNED